MASVNADPPPLPTELERAIFEVAAVSWPRSIPKFMLVTWRVKKWLEPLLYRTLVVADDRDRDRGRDSRLPSIAPDTLRSLIHSKSPTFFRDSVRHLSLIEPEAEDVSILTACSAIENLWLGAHPSINILEINLPLKRLHCALYSLFRDASIDFTHRFFTSITHLEIVNVAQNIEVEVWSALTRLPHLTHLAFNSYSYLEMCLAILLTWEHLHALVILSLFDIGEKSLEQHNVPELAQESRLVVIACSDFREDWVRGATLGRDYWSQAEDFIAKRRSRKIDPLEYYISESTRKTLDSEAKPMPDP
ncbi:hypothetical protein B0H14DRAFT_3168523 [Mycena olivaceomarginata]|nr:hypothetical protein B0H14DRAFT_3168523 [Mycena olivaceomarginata]